MDRPSTCPPHIHPTPRCWPRLVSRAQHYALTAPPLAQLAVCTMIHNEAPYLAEWVLYHWVLGFQYFFLYDNASSDVPAAAPSPFVSRAIVTLLSLPWPGKAPQGAQLNHCFNRSRTDAKWMASFDVDEFVSSPANSWTWRR